VIGREIAQYAGSLACAEIGPLCDVVQTRTVWRHRIFLIKVFRPFAGTGRWEKAMSVNKDQIRGRVKQAKGNIKEAAGKLLGNEKLRAKGKVQKILGKAQAKFGDVKQNVKDAAKKKK